MAKKQQSRSKAASGPLREPKAEPAAEPLPSPEAGSATELQDEDLSREFGELLRLTPETSSDCPVLGYSNAQDERNLIRAMWEARGYGALYFSRVGPTANPIVSSIGEPQTEIQAEPLGFLAWFLRSMEFAYDLKHSDSGSWIVKIQRKQWAWDLTPVDLAASWGNVQTVGTTPGEILTLRRWAEQSDTVETIIFDQWWDRVKKRDHRFVGGFFRMPSQPLYRPASDTVPPLFEDGGTRAFYVPTESDLALSAKLLPDKLNPGGVTPNWRTLREALVQKGCEPGRLIQMTPRELLGLLAKHYVTLNGRPRDLELPEEITGELFRLWNSRAVGATPRDIANRYNESSIGKQHSQTFPEVSVDASYVRKAVNAQRSRNRRRPQ